MVKKSIFSRKVTSGIAPNSTGDLIPYLTPMSNIDGISHYNINKISSTQVMRIENFRADSKGNSDY